MAISTYEESYIKYFGRRFENLSHGSTYEDLKELYDEYAEAYDKVKTPSSNIKFIKYHLLTESEVITGKSQTEALMY